MYSAYSYIFRDSDTFRLMMGRKESEGMEKDFGAGERADGCCYMFDKIKRKVYDE